MYCSANMDSALPVVLEALRSDGGIYTVTGAPEAESSFGAPLAAEFSTGLDVAMAGTAPADAELLDDADTDSAAAAADRYSASQSETTIMCLWKPAGGSTDNIQKESGPTEGQVYR